MVLIMLDGAVNQVCIEHFLLLLPYTLPLKFFCEYNFHNILLTLLKKIGQGNYPRYKRLFRNRTRWVVLGIKKFLMTKWSVLTVARRWAHSSWLTIMATMRMSKLWGKLSTQKLLFSSFPNVQYQKRKLVLAPVLWTLYSMEALSWLKDSHLCLLNCLRTKFFLGTTAMRWLSVASQTTAGLIPKPSPSTSILFAVCTRKTQRLGWTSLLEWGRSSKTKRKYPKTRF